MKILENVQELITQCEDSFAEIGIAAQRYIDAHNEYLEASVEDSSFLKEKMKEKVARVIDL